MTITFADSILERLRQGRRHHPVPRKGWIEARIVEVEGVAEREAGAQAGDEGAADVKAEMRQRALLGGPLAHIDEERLAARMLEDIAVPDRAVEACPGPMEPQEVVDGGGDGGAGAYDLEVVAKAVAAQ